MNEFVTAFFVVIVFTLGSAAYYNNRARSQSNGGFAFSPIPFILVNYALIFAYRPFVILYYDAPTLNFEEIDFERAHHAIQLGMLSLCAIFLPYIAHLRVRASLTPPPVHSEKNNILVDRLFWLNIFFSALVLCGLFIYGSALNNTGDRIDNPASYRGFFLFIIIQRFHFVLSILTFYSFLSAPSRNKWRLPLFAFILVAPFLTLLSAGRGATFYLLIAYGVIYVFTRSVRVSWKHVAYIVFFGVLFSLLNFLLSIVRVVISSTGWEWGDVMNAMEFSDSTARLEELLVLASWDYSVFDVFVTIVNNLDGFTFGGTNLQYFLSYIPRIFWPDKPLDQGFMLYVTNKFYGDVFSLNGSTFAGTLAGEGYLNFGVVGIFLYSFVFSLVFYLVYRRACRRKDSYSIIIYSLAFPFSQQVIRGGLDVIINFVLLILIPLWLMNRAIRYKSRSSKAGVLQMMASGQ